MTGFIANLLDRASLRLAVAGDGAGNLEIAGRGNFIYARAGGADGEVFEVRTSAIRPNYDDVIYAQAENPALPATWRTVFWLRDGTDTTLPAPVVGTDYVRYGLTDDLPELLTDDSDIFLESP